MALRWLGGTPALLARTLRDAEWKPLLDFVTPAFFEVMPARALLGQGRELVGNARDRERFRAVTERSQRALDARGVAVRLEPDEDAEGPRELAEQPEAERRARGQRVLEIYFAQLLGSEVALLDLRADRFAGDGPDLAWRPGPYYVAWDGAFLDALRRLYRGFYRDDEAMLAGALATLRLEGARDVLLGHFGAGDQTTVRFDRRHFQSSFHDVFVHCKEAGIRLHANFLPLGVYLATLYDHLALLDAAFDVRAAFERADGR